METRWGWLQVTIREKNVFLKASRIEIQKNYQEIQKTWQLFHVSYVYIPGEQNLLAKRNFWSKKFRPTS